MSIHVKLSEEAQKKLNAQRRNSTISSIVVSILAIVIVGLLLGLVLLPTITKEEVTIVTYKASTTPEEKPQEQKTKSKVQKKPTAPAQSQVKVVSVNSASSVSIPVPDVSIEAEVVDFGDNADFGGGWGEDLAIGAEGGATFFEQEVKAERVAFVIDYSLSMRGLGRNELMREELAKSIKGLSTGTKYQMIFFAGHAWVASDELRFKGGGPKGTHKVLTGVTDISGKEIETSDKKRYANRKVSWLDVTSSNIKDSLAKIENTPLVLGTDWGPPLELAMNMKPKPQVIFFMTDGLTGGNINKVVDDLSTDAKRAGITVNTVALMEPKADEFMLGLAQPTGGLFTLVEKGGKSRVIGETKEGEKEEEK